LNDKPEKLTGGGGHEDDDDEEDNVDCHEDSKSDINDVYGLLLPYA